MISEEEKEIILRFVKKYKVSSVYLFGSSLDNFEYNDIDLAVHGRKPPSQSKYCKKVRRFLYTVITKENKGVRLYLMFI